MEFSTEICKEVAVEVIEEIKECSQFTYESVSDELLTELCKEIYTEILEEVCGNLSEELCN